MERAGLEARLVRRAGETPYANADGEDAERIGSEGVGAGVDLPALVQGKAASPQEQDSAKMIHGVSLQCEWVFLIVTLGGEFDPTATKSYGGKGTARLPKGRFRHVNAQP